VSATGGTSRWRELRERLSHDRLALLQFLSAVTGYDPLPHQIRAHLAQAPAGRTTHKLVLGGIGSGKSYWGVMEDLLMAIASPGRNIAILAPTYDQCLHVLLPQIREMADKLSARGYPLIRKYKHSTAVAEMVCGGRIFLRSFDRVDSIRGFTFSAVHLDESEQVMRPGYVFDTIAGRIRDPEATIRQLHVTTTPKGTRGVVKKFMDQRAIADAMEDEMEGVEHRRSWWVGRAPSSANTYLPEGYLDSLRQGYSARQWDQEVEAQVLKPESAVYGEFSLDRHLIPYTYDPALPWDLAMDYGDQRPHYLAIQRFPDGRAVVFEEFCADEWPVDRKNKWVTDMVERLGKQPEHMAGDRARKDRIQWVAANLTSTWCHRMRSRRDQDVAMGIELVRTALDPLDGQPRLFFADHLNQPDRERGILKCLGNYRRKVRADGTISDEPFKDGRFDNGADALRYWMVAVGSGAVSAYVSGRQPRVRKGVPGRFARPRN